MTSFCENYRGETKTEVLFSAYHIEKTLPLGSWTWCTGGVDLMGWKVNLQPKLIAESLRKEAWTIGL